MDDLMTAIQELFRSVFDRPELMITRESNANSVEGWDSLMHISLVTAIEHKYKIKFKLGELQDLKHVGDLVDLVQEKRGRSTTLAARPN
jgi:acyl carrier protein